ncbi:MAG: glycoside hydrolase [Anaerolineae bacterium]|nr:glycoside hydrolase [Anaerolineae bacterium]
MDQATIRVDCNARQGRLRRIWTSIGYDEINWTITPRGKAVLNTLREIAEVPYIIRNHNALTSGNGLSRPAWGSTHVYHEMPDGSVRYDWSLLDQIYDVYVERGFRPLIELGFLPLDLVPDTAAQTADWSRDVGQERYETDGLWKYPPKDDDRWAELVAAFVTHWVERYGPEEVETWYFELWNEPNLPNYWKGTAEDYFRLYRVTVAAATRALPTVKIGGPATTTPGIPMFGGDFFPRFLAFCVDNEVRLDFVSFHTKGGMYTPRRIYNPYLPVKKEHPMSAVMMQDMHAALDMIARYPQLKGIPVLVDECDPVVGTIYGVYDNPNFIVTNTEHYPTFLCALIKRILDLDAHFETSVSLITSWAFYFEGKRFFEGNRALVTNENIEKPVLNAFRMLSRMGETRLQATSNRSRNVLDPEAPAAEIDALAAISGERVTVLVWHQADPWWLEGTAEVTLQLASLPFEGQAAVRHYRIDGDHSNAYAAWVQQGEPQEPTPVQIKAIKARQGLELLEPPFTIPTEGNALTLTFALTLYGASLIEIEPASSRLSQPRN